MPELTLAVVLATTPRALTRIAGLPLAVRAVLALEAAGVGEIAILAGEHAARLRPFLARRSVAGRLTWLDPAEGAAPLPAAGPALVLVGDVALDEVALAPLRAASLADSRQVVRVVAPRGGLRLVLCPPSLLPSLLDALAGGRRSLSEALARLRALDGPTVSLGPGLYAPLEGARDRGAVEEAVLDSLARRTAAKDSYLAALIDRRLSRPVTRLVLRSPVTPSQLTLGSIALGLAGAAGLATGSYGGRLAGVLALIASIVLDCADGEVARARAAESPAGARLDLVGDYVVNLAVFVGLGIGVVRQGSPPGAVWAILLLVGGVAAAMAVMHGLFVRPSLRAGGDLHWAGDGQGIRGTAVAPVVEKIASRDYTYLLLVLALLGRLEWFLYAAAVGAWLFVAGVLGLAFRQRGAAKRPAMAP